MTAFYDSLIKAANKLITSKGQSVTFTRVTLGSYNPATSSNTITETNYTVNAAPLPYKDSVFSSSDLIQQGDCKLLVSPLQTSGVAMVQLKPQDKVTIQGEIWIIVNAKPLVPNGTLIYQTCQIRK